MPGSLGSVGRTPAKGKPATTWPRRSAGGPTRRPRPRPSSRQWPMTQNYADADALYAAVGDSHVSPRSPPGRRGSGRLTRGRGQRGGPVPARHRPPARTGRGIRGRGAGRRARPLGPCCTPVPGDPGSSASSPEPAACRSTGWTAPHGVARSDSEEATGRRQLGRRRRLSLRHHHPRHGPGCAAAPPGRVGGTARPSRERRELDHVDGRRCHGDDALRLRAHRRRTAASVLAAIRAIDVVYDASACFQAGVAEVGDLLTRVQRNGRSRPNRSARSIGRSRSSWGVHGEYLAGAARSVPRGFCGRSARTAPTPRRCACGSISTQAPAGSCGSLEDAELVTTEPAAADQQVRTVALTHAGRVEREGLDRRSDEQAGRAHAANEAHRAQLVDAMAVVERLLTAGLVELGIEDPAGDVARFCTDGLLHREAQHRDSTPAIPTRASRSTPQS